MTNHMDSKLETVLDEINSFGKYQIINFILLCLPVFLTAIHGMAYVFTTGSPTFRCKIPECDGDNHIYDNSGLKYSIPFENNEPSQCFRYGNVESNQNRTAECVRDYFNVSNIIKCSEFLFKNEREISIAREWNFLCQNDEWKMSMVGTVISVGQFFGLGVSGYFSDKYGRKGVLIKSIIASGIFGTAKALSQNYNVFISLEFLENFCVAGLYASAFILGKLMHYFWANSF